MIGYYVAVWNDGFHAVVNYEDSLKVKETEGWLVNISITSISQDVAYGTNKQWQLKQRKKETHSN